MLSSFTLVTSQLSDKQIHAKSVGKQGKTWTDQLAVKKIHGQVNMRRSQLADWITRTCKIYHSYLYGYISDSP